MRKTILTCVAVLTAFAAGLALGWWWRSNAGRPTPPPPRHSAPDAEHEQARHLVQAALQAPWTAPGCKTVVAKVTVGRMHVNSENPKEHGMRIVGKFQDPAGGKVHKFEFRAVSDLGIIMECITAKGPADCLVVFRPADEGFIMTEGHFVAVIPLPVSAGQGG